MNDLIYFTTTGFYLGYSKEAVVAFLQRRNDVDNRRVSIDTPTSQGTHLEGMGFIPSSRELAMTREEVISDINSRRMHGTPFPETGDDLDEEVETFFKGNPEEAVRLNWIAYLLYVVHNTGFLTEVSHESHLHIDPERRVRPEVQTGRPS